MYLPQHFAETDRDTLIALIRSHPLGLLISASADQLLANPVPFLVVDRGDSLFLQSHVARANPQWKHVADGAQVLAVFQGPESYVSPSFYPSKAEHGKVVPTWNYVIVEARGLATVHDDAQWLQRQITDLTNLHEAGRETPWKVDDAPQRFTETMIRGIVGIEIAVTDLTGKWKLSQNRNDADREGVRRGLEREQALSIAGMMAAGGGAGN